jgi:mono/diheme cytochrome c family protein
MPSTANAMNSAIVLACGISATLAALPIAVAASDIKQVALGRALYEQHCAVCHGVHGEGTAGWEQPNAQGELPAPPHDRSGHTWKHSDAMLYRIVRQGWRDPFNKTDRLTMPAFKAQLSHADTIALIEYLKTLWTPEQQQFQAEESSGHPFPSEKK